MKHAIAVIGARADKIRQDIVDIGGADEPGDGQSHLPGVISRQDIAEVAGGHHDVHRFAQSQTARLQQIAVGRDIVNNLRHQAAPVD